MPRGPAPERKRTSSKLLLLQDLADVPGPGFSVLLPVAVPVGAVGTGLALLAAVYPLLPVGDRGGPPPAGLGFCGAPIGRFFAISYQPIEVIPDLDEGGEVLLGQLVLDVFGDQGGVLCNLVR